MQSGHLLLATHLFYCLLLIPFGPLDALVARDDDGDLAPGEVADLEALQVERGQQHLQAHQVFEFEVAHAGLAVTELLDKPLEATADPLAGQHVVLLDAAFYGARQEGLVAENGGKAVVGW